MSDFKPIVILLVCAFLFIGAFGFGCAAIIADEGKAISALEKAGFTNVQITGKSYFAALTGCGEDDVVSYNATATNPQGQTVKVGVCLGILKDTTIRY